MAITKNVTNPAPISSVSPAGAPDTTGWMKEQTGFAPYWTPSEGKLFFGRVVSRDERDPEFVRYLIQLEQDELACQSGPKDDPTDVIVRKGDTFTVSVYVQLDGLFNEYLESGIFPLVCCKALKEVKTKTAGQTCWTFDLRVNPQEGKKLLAYRQEKAQVMAAARTERAAIQA